MKLLILGGTQFLGRHLTESALARGHEVTHFNRGKTNDELYPTVEKLHGDRDGNLHALAGRRWDAVIDTSGYVPRIVRASVEMLANAVDHYTFISTISVYSDFTQANDENSPVIELEDQTTEVITGETYGGLKVLCERVVQTALPEKALIVRPGLIVGPHDPSDRFTYWVERVAKGGEVLAPGSPEMPIQVIDGRDLAEWVIRMVEAKKTGIYNATGPATPLTMGDMLATCQAASGSDAHIHWVSEAFLLERDIQPSRDLPLWIPSEMPGFGQINIQRALQEGLTFRPLAETVQATLGWHQQQPLKVGLNAEREQSVLAEWKQQ